MSLLLLLLVAAFPALARADDVEASLKRFTEVYRLLETNLAEGFDPERAIYQGAIPGMVRTLDPHSAFLDPDQYESLKEMQRSTEKGFGSVLQLTPGRAVVLQTLPESPSARAGLSSGDEIAVINGMPLAQLTLEQLVQVLSRSRNRQAELMIKRPNFARLIPLTLVPAEMADPSVEHKFFLKPGVAYIKVANFEATTAEDFRRAVEEMGGSELKGLVLDLRNNPGGVVGAAVRMASFFLEPDQRILWIHGREGPTEEVKVPPVSKPYRFPLAVMIDERTASAAELVTAALQDNSRAVVVGLRSYGKGLVQSVFDLSGGSGLALTTALYQSPMGRTIQRPMGDCNEYQLGSCDPEKTGEKPTWGVEPDRVVGPRGYTPLEAALKGSNSFFDFARRWVQKHGAIEESFEPSSEMLDEFQLFLSERRIRPNLADWTATLEFIRANLTQEIFNLTIGVKKGDEIELKRDRQVLAAVAALEGR